MVVPVAVVLIRLGGIVYRASNTPTGRALIKKLLEKGGKIIKNTKTNPKTLTGTVAKEIVKRTNTTKPKTESNLQKSINELRESASKLKGKKLTSIDKLKMSADKLKVKKRISTAEKKFNLGKK
tara:strand:- start:100 stop:471 length:372 start_codon:yes stop_codon:yes gene_type:complete